MRDRTGRKRTIPSDDGPETPTPSKKRATRPKARQNGSDALEKAQATIDRLRLQRDESRLRTTTLSKAQEKTNKAADTAKKSKDGKIAKNSASKLSARLEPHELAGQWPDSD